MRRPCAYRPAIYITRAQLVIGGEVLVASRCDRGTLGRKGPGIRMGASARRVARHYLGTPLLGSIARGHCLQEQQGLVTNNRCTKTVSLLSQAFWWMSDAHAACRCELTTISSRRYIDMALSDVKQPELVRIYKAESFGCQGCV